MRRLRRPCVLSSLHCVHKCMPVEIKKKKKLTKYKFQQTTIEFLHNICNAFDILVV